MWHTHTFVIYGVSYIVNILCCLWPKYYRHWCNPNCQDISADDYKNNLIRKRYALPLYSGYDVTHCDSIYITDIQIPIIGNHGRVMGCLPRLFWRKKWQRGVDIAPYWWTCGKLLKSCNQHANVKNIVSWYSCNQLRWNYRLYSKRTCWRYFKSSLGLGE